MQLKWNLDLPPRDTNTLPIGIVMTGGGNKCRCQIGFEAALFQIPEFVPNVYCIAGTSGGGLNTIITAYYIDNFIKAVMLWESIDCNKKIYKGNLGSKVFDRLGQALSLIMDKESFLDATPLHDLLKGIFLDMTLQDIKKISNLDIIIPAADLNRKRAEVYVSWDKTGLIKAADAGSRTSAIPGLFQAIQGKDYHDNDSHIHSHVDGGILINNPYEEMVHYFEKVQGLKPHEYRIVILKSAKTCEKASEEIYNKIMKTLARTVETTLSGQEYLVEDKINHENTMVIEPNFDTGDAINFGNTDILQKGYDQVYVMLDKIRDFITKKEA